MTDIAEQFAMSKYASASDRCAAMMDEIETLRARLAQPEAEPVALMALHDINELMHCNGMSVFVENPRIYPPYCEGEPLAGFVPLYATPQAQPAPTGKAPCARHCEATAFRNEIRRLEFELRKAQPTPAVQPCTSKPVDSQNAPDLTVRQFDRLCDLLPHGASWGDSLTPAIVQGICEMIAAAPAVQPLTDEQIDTLSDHLWEQGHIQSLSKDTARIFSRAIEQTHGIGTQGGEHG